MDKWLAAISKLIKLTQDRKITWAIRSTPEVLINNDTIIENVFVAKYKDKTLRIYKKQYKKDPRGFLPTVIDEAPYYKVILEFIDDLDNSIWKFPETKALNDLLSSVQYQVAGVRDFIDDILNED